MQVDAKPKRLENSHGTRARRCGILTVCVALLLTVGVITLAVFTDRASHSMQFTTASFNADAYSLTRTAPVGPFCAGESVTATLEEGNSGNDAVCSVIAMRAAWDSPDTALSIFGNANAADNAKLTVDGTEVSYAVSADKKSITFNLPEQVLEAGSSNKPRDLTLTIPESFKSTGSVSFTFEKVVVGQEGGGFSETYDRNSEDPDIKALDYSAKVGWAASSLTAQNGKALMGYLTGKNAAGKYGIEFELAFGYTSSPMKDFASRTDARWSHYKGAVDTLAFVEGMTSIGDYAFPDFTGVKSVSFPATVRTIGVSAFDASGLTGTVTIPATVKEIQSLAFGNLPSVKTFTFGHGSGDTLTLPDNAAAGKERAGAFFVSENLPTEVSDTNADVLAYNWAKDNRCYILTIPAQKGTLTYNEKPQTPGWDSNYVSSRMSVGGETSKTNAGSYTATFAPKFGNCWADLTTGAKSVTWKIDKAPGSLSLSKTTAEIGYYDTSASFTVEKAGDGKISATSSDPSVATVTVSGNTVTVTRAGGGEEGGETWLLNEQGMFPSKDFTGISFVSNGQTFTSIRRNKMFLRYDSTVVSVGAVTPDGFVFGEGGWGDNEAYRKLTFAEPPAGDLLAWLMENGVKQGADTGKKVEITITVGEGTNHKSVTEGKTCSVNVLTPKIVPVPAQEGSLTYNGKSQTPTWNENYDNNKMTLGGVTSGTDAGGYKATFTPKTGYIWSDGTIAAKEVTWEIGKAPGSLTLSKTTAKIDAKETTTTFTATWIGDGKLSAKSSDTSVATVSMDGNVVTVTKKAGGSVIITVTVAEGTNWRATSEDCVIACVGEPILAANKTWYKSSQDRNTITRIAVMDSYTPTGSENESWDASAAQDGSVMAYRTGTEIVIAGDGSGKVFANRDSRIAFGDFSAMTTFAGANVLDTSKVTDMAGMFQLCSNLTSLDVTKFDTSKVTNMGSVFHGCSKLTSLNVTDFNTSNVTNMSYMFNLCNALTGVDGLSDWDTAKVTDMRAMFQACRALTGLDLSGWDASKVTDMAFTFNSCKNLTELDLSGWDTAKVTNMTYMFAGCEGLTSLDLASFDTASVSNMRNMFGGFVIKSSDNVYGSNIGEIQMTCRKLERITLGAKFKFVGTECYLPTPSSAYIADADGKWYDTKDAAGYTPAALAGVTRAETRTYVALPPRPLEAPAQTEVLTYNGKAQTPGWDSNYEPGKMTVGGTTSGTNAGSYTATFTPKTNYKWADGTSTPKSVTWKIGKAAGSLSLSKTEAEIGADATTTTFTVNRAGDGVISATSSNTSIATVSVSGTTVTVTKKGGGTATITVKVAEGTNYLAPADATCEVTCKVEPVLAANSTWYKSSQNRNTITKISIVDEYTPTGSENESWDASAKRDKSVMAYRTGTEIVIAGTGFGKIYANEDSSYAFSYNKYSNEFQKLTTIEGLNLLDTSKVTNMSNMFYSCSKLTSLDVTNFDTSKVINMSAMFRGCSGLTSLDVTKFNTSNVTNMRSMFMYCSKLTRLDVTNFDTSKVTNMKEMFMLGNMGADIRSVLRTLDVSGFDTSNVTDMSYMFWSCTDLTSIDVTKFNTAKVTDMGNMFGECQSLTSLDVSSFNTSNVTNMKTMFGSASAGSGGLKNLNNLDVTNFDTSKVTDMSCMFRDIGVTSLDLSSFRTLNVTKMEEMFRNCKRLTTIYASDGWTTSQVDVSGGHDCFVFDGCTNLRGAISYSSSKTNASYANYTTGYLTYKAAPAKAAARAMSIMSNGSEISGYSVSE